MRDFRDAKAMAHSLRAALAAQSLKITNSQSLELIAEAFGVADWNTLSAAIRAAAEAPRRDEPPRRPDPKPWLSAGLESTLQAALASAKQRHHEYATLEHLLLALIDDVDASAVMHACGADLGTLKRHLARYIDNDLKTLEIGDDRDAFPTVAFRRVVQRAMHHVQNSDLDTLTGAQLLLALFSERESPAAQFLAEQGVTRLDAANFVAHGSTSGGGGAA
jgi:hypothetical protein